MSGRGRVVLVGAGPGDPDLITLRGDAALRAADVVVYDALAPPELLAHARPDAELIDVGKRGHDPPSRSQEDVQALLVERARAGKLVVRLKGGDPFVFGRGGEEASACRAAGVDVEVVPGISSPIGALAYAGIPVTDRRHAASFAVVTGHKDPGVASEETRWEGLAHAADTLVVLMGMRNLEEIVRRILGGGRSVLTPAAAVMLGTTPRQRVVEAPLGKLAAAVREAGLGAPAVIVVGDVVRLRGELAWFEARPLFGASVLVTRAPEQAEELLRALRDAGAATTLIPLIRIEAAGEPELQERVLASLDGFDAILLTSANAVRALDELARDAGATLAGRRAYCVGPATAEAARAAGLRVALVPAEARDAAALAQAILRDGPVAGRRFLLPRAVHARAGLPEALRDEGAGVDELVVYRTVPADVDAARLRSGLVLGEFDTLCFASPSAVRAFAAVLDESSREAAGRATIAAIGPTTAAALAEEGLPAHVQPERPSAPRLVEALVAHRSARRSP